MMFKRIFILSFFAAFSLILAAQPLISTTQQQFDLGRVKSNAPVIIRIPIENVGNKKLEIRDVKTSCGCVKPDETQMTIKPGKMRFITITFNTDIIGSFNKFVDIYSNAKNSPLLLTLYGTVVDDEPHAANTQIYPYIFKEDLYLSQKNLDFGELRKGEKKDMVFRIYNGSNYSYTPRLLHLPNYLTAECQPKIIHKGRVGIMTVSLDTDKMQDYGLVQTHTCLARFSGDMRKSHENEMPLSVMLLPQLQVMPNNPVVQVDTLLDIDKKAVVNIRNAGNRPLQILAVQPLNKAIKAHLPKKFRTVPSYKSVPLEVKYDSQKRNHAPLQVLLITNDPVRPEVRVRINSK